MSPLLVSSKTAIAPKDAPRGGTWARGGTGSDGGGIFQMPT